MEPHPTPTPFDYLTQAAALSFARQSGALHGAVLAELVRVGSAAHDGRQVARNHIAGLRTDGYITGVDKGLLEQIGEVMYDASSPADAARTIKGLVAQIENQPAPSPCGVTIGRVALNSITVVARTDGKKTYAAADLGGALTGGSVGKSDGIWGLLAGVVIGGVAVSLTTAHGDENAPVLGQ
jgi:hypothetical protein